MKLFVVEGFIDNYSKTIEICESQTSALAIKMSAEDMLNDFGSPAYDFVRIRERELYTDAMLKEALNAIQI